MKEKQRFSLRKSKLGAVSVLVGLTIAGGVVVSGTDAYAAETEEVAPTTASEEVTDAKLVDADKKVKDADALVNTQKPVVEAKETEHSKKAEEVAKLEKDVEEAKTLTAEKVQKAKDDATAKDNEVKAKETQKNDADKKVAEKQKAKDDADKKVAEKQNAKNEKDAEVKKAEKEVNDAKNAYGEKANEIKATEEEIKNKEALLKTKQDEKKEKDNQLTQAEASDKSLETRKNDARSQKSVKEAEKTSKDQELATAQRDLATKRSELDKINTDLRTAVSPKNGISAEILEPNKQQILDRLNEIRREAVRLGYANRYVPLKWSKELEEMSIIRAAEAGIKISHERPGGGQYHTILTDKGYKVASGENLAWNGTGNLAAIMQGIEQWYSEKAEFYDKDPNHVSAGHYRSIINPDYTYTAVSGAVVDNPVEPRMPYSIAQLLAGEGARLTDGLINKYGKQIITRTSIGVDASTLNAEKQTKEAEVRTLEQKVNTLRTEISTLNSELVTINRTLNEQPKAPVLRSEITKLTNEITNITNEVNIAKNKLQTLINSNTQAKNTLDNANQKLADTKQDADAAKTDLDNAKQDATTAQTNLDNAKKDVDKAKSDLDKAKEDATNAKKEADRLDNLFTNKTQLEKTLTQAKNDLATLAAELKTEKDKLANLTKDAKDAKDALDKLLADYKKQLNANIKPEEVDFKTVEVTDSNLEKGKREVRTTGVKGSKIKELTPRVENGKVVIDTTEKELVKPVDQVIAVGTKDNTTPQRPVVILGKINAVDNGDGTVTYGDDDDNTGVTVTIPKDGLGADVEALYVEKVQIQRLGRNFETYEIYFRDKDGKAVQITRPAQVTLPANGRVINAYHVDRNGQILERVPFVMSADNRYVTLTVNHFSLYALEYLNTVVSTPINTQTQGERGTTVGEGNTLGENTRALPKTDATSNNAAGLGVVGLVALAVASRLRKKEK